MTDTLPRRPPTQLLLTLGCSLPLLLGLFLVKPVLARPAHAVPADFSTRESGWARAPPGVEYEALLEETTEEEEDDDGEDESELEEGRTLRPSFKTMRSPSRTPLLPSQVEDEENALVKIHSRSQEGDVIGPPNISGLALARSLDFWLLFAFVGLISGTGLMWINNVGLATLALFSEGNPGYDRLEAARLQSAQVALISVWNCAGRVLIGEFSLSDLDRPHSSPPSVQTLILDSSHLQCSPSLHQA